MRCAQYPNNHHPTQGVTRYGYHAAPSAISHALGTNHVHLSRIVDAERPSRPGISIYSLVPPAELKRARSALSILILMKTHEVRHTDGQHRMPTHMYASTCTAARIPIPCTETRNIRMHSDPCERTQTRIQSDTPLAAEPRCARPHLYPILPAVSPDASRISAQTFRASVAEHAEQRGQPAAAVTSRPSAA